MKRQPKAVYIIENGGYTELTYEEFRRREQICPLYADKLFLPLYGSLVEVSKEDYTEFYRAKRRQKYLDERSADNGDFSYDMLTTDEFSGEDTIRVEFIMDDQVVDTKIFSGSDAIVGYDYEGKPGTASTVYARINGVATESQVISF